MLNRLHTLQVDHFHDTCYYDSTSNYIPILLGNKRHGRECKPKPVYLGPDPSLVGGKWLGRLWQKFNNQMTKGAQQLSGNVRLESTKTS